MPYIRSFRRVIQRFEISGGNAQPKKRQGKGIPDDNIKHDYFYPIYNKLLKEKVWPAVRAKATRNALWYMQDGATCHTSQNNLYFLLDKFDGRVISNKTDVIWPPNSPDLNSLDTSSKRSIELNQQQLMT